jgi:protein gp37
LKLGTPYLVEEELEAVVRLSTRIEEGKADPEKNKMFWNDMTDELLDFWPDEFLDQLWAVRALTPNLIHQVLTKRAERLCRYLTGDGHKARHYRIESIRLDGDVARRSDIRCEIVKRGGREGYEHIEGLQWPLKNVHLGVSVEDQNTADERIPWLLRAPGAVRWVSYEPALGPVDFEATPAGDILSLCEGCGDTGNDGTGAANGCELCEGLGRLNWIVVGGESGPGARPFNVQWARDTISQCKAARVPVFVKQLGKQPREHGYYLGGDYGFKSVRLKDKKGGSMDEWPDDLKVREYPNEQAR